MSESVVLRDAVAVIAAISLGDTDAPLGLLAGRPFGDSAVGEAMWTLYESGDIVLRRSRHEGDIVTAASFHLRALEAAVTSPLLPLRLRTMLLPDRSAVLAVPGPLHDLAGHDRRLARRGVIVLPTTVALIDPATCEVVLPDQSDDTAIPSGRHPVRSILLRDAHEPDVGEANLLLVLARTLIRDPDRDLQRALDQTAQLADHGVAVLVEGDEIKRTVGALGASARS